MRPTDSTLLRWTLGILCAAGLGGHGLRGACADDALDRFFNGEFFADWPGEFRYSRVNQSLSLALLRLSVALGNSGFSTVPVGANEEVVVRPKSKDADEALGYRRPVFYSRIGDVALVFMFKPGAPVDLLAVGPSEKCPEPVRGFIWRIRSAEKGRAYKLDVRVGLLPVSSLGKVEQEYQRWSD